MQARLDLYLIDSNAATQAAYIGFPKGHRVDMSLNHVQISITGALEAANNQVLTIDQGEVE